VTTLEDRTLLISNLEAQINAVIKGYDWKVMVAREERKED